VGAELRHTPILRDYDHLIETAVGWARDHDVAIPMVEHDLPYVDILVVEGDHVASDHLYWDQVELLTQLGLMPAEPVTAEG
jgi:hypothetical protein